MHLERFFDPAKSKRNDLWQLALEFSEAIRGSLIMHTGAEFSFLNAEEKCLLVVDGSYMTARKRFGRNLSFKSGSF